MLNLLNTPKYVPEELVGRTLAVGRYHLKNQLGEGSMAFVYGAWDNRLQTDVVVKIPRPEKIADEQFRLRFSQERNLLVKLSHPHIVRIVDIGDDDGLPYVVMQYLSGGDLLQQLNRVKKNHQRLSRNFVGKWIRENGRALDFVANQGMVHRDVKPANILFDEHKNAFLSDFGLTKIVCGDHRDSDSDMTAAGFIVGTPNYVAPEIILGEDYDGRADQYALGLIVYHMMIGTPPMQGPSSSATMVNQTQRTLPLLCDLRQDLPRQMAIAVDKAISKKPADRFPSSEAFADAVITALSKRHSFSSSSNKTSQSASKTVHEYREARSLPPRRSRSPKTGSEKNSGSVRRESLSAHPFHRRKELVPCPYCQQKLSLKPIHSGRRGRCIQCHSRLKVSSDLTRLHLIAAIDAPGENMRLDKSPSDSSELMIGEELFGRKLDKSQAIFLALTTLTMLVAATVYITVFLNSESEEERIRRETSKARIIESNTEDI